MSIPRDEYPRPQFRRDQWLCLNGKWQFEIDSGDSGLVRGLRDGELAQSITVPFCPESELSGIANTDFMECVWYRRTQRVPADWQGKRILLHFQAVDYDATVWANGTEVGRHRGGFTPFTCDITAATTAGDDVTIAVRARDFRDDPKPRGKQCPDYASRGCLYTRTTGIWQTVWLEPVPTLSFRRPRITPDATRSEFRIATPLLGNPAEHQVCGRILVDGEVIAEDSVPADTDMAPNLRLKIPEDRAVLWQPGEPFLYDITLSLRDPAGNVIDSLQSYSALRSVAIHGRKVLINGSPVFQRLVLDQGYYPDGIMTAPSDEALRRDIELSMAAGFNGARLHQKVFEERFLYHADTLGYLVWGEFADWHPRTDRRMFAGQDNTPFVAQWLEALARDYSHPSIVGWCPLNETHGKPSDRIEPLHDITHAMYNAAKAMDLTRPVLDTSGWAHRVRESDIYDGHDYEQDPAKFAERHAGLAQGQPRTEAYGGNGSVPYNGQPFFVSEFGGIWWNAELAAASEGSDRKESWGYGERVSNVEEFYSRFEGLCSVLLDDPNMFGYCYTQLTDVFQEQNGIYSFARAEKFDMGRIRVAQTRPAAIEQRS